MAKKGVINIKYGRGDYPVYIKTDTNNTKRMITGIILRDGVSYELSAGLETSIHYEYEITTDEDFISDGTCLIVSGFVGKDDKK